MNHAIVTAIRVIFNVIMMTGEKEKEEEAVDRSIPMNDHHDASGQTKEWH